VYLSTATTFLFGGNAIIIPSCCGNAGFASKPLLNPQLQLNLNIVVVKCLEVDTLACYLRLHMVVLYGFKTALIWFSDFRSFLRRPLTQVYVLLRLTHIIKKTLTLIFI
jgi:hypothetical protein